MFKVGDKVIVKTSLEDNQHYGGVYFNPIMKKYCGNRYTVTGVDTTSYSDNGIVYTLSDKNGVLRDKKVTNAWHFSDDMLQPEKRDCKFMKRYT